jgi:heterotetrameric sarcosine oxidase gamma subunit
VADFAWTASSPLQHATTPGRRGAAVHQPGIILSEVRDFSLVLILARRGQGPATAKAARARFGVEAPPKPQAVAGKSAALIWSGADQFYALFANAEGQSPVEALRDSFAGKASLSDQSDGRALIRISGASARKMLAKLSSLDFEDEIFPVGAAAATSIDHTGVNLWRGANAFDGSPVFNLLVFTSFADSIWHTILDSSAEYGTEIVSSHGL